ncbi:hypothetical protein [Amycolatopsis sp. NBC_01286]|uniref:hypothetical protein n=1 Tax=Amycolatopsis sp. NBC_01286 TaxID=2903560 RepID=UPI002E130288|nr:hypothetical protein OG570_16955 [Amycolatopsis sp. NBC_01286]
MDIAHVEELQVAPGREEEPPIAEVEPWFDEYTPPVRGLYRDRGVQAPPCWVPEDA